MVLALGMVWLLYFWLENIVVRPSTAELTHFVRVYQRPGHDSVEAVTARAPQRLCIFLSERLPVAVDLTRNEKMDHMGAAGNV
jgi:hypothetical protein